MPYVLLVFQMRPYPTLYISQNTYSSGMFSGDQKCTSSKIDCRLCKHKAAAIICTQRTGECQEATEECFMLSKQLFPNNFNP